MKKKLLLLILMVLPLFISSCSDDDGKVDPMKWKTELKKSSDGYFHVSPGGGTFVLQCTNYSDFWITGITEQEAKGEEKKFTPPPMMTKNTLPLRQIGQQLPKMGIR